MIYLRIILSLVLTIALVTGCGGRRGTARPHFAAPPSPPAVPVERPIPLDPQLIESARREIRSALSSNDEVIRANAVEAAQRGLGVAAAADILAALRDRQPVVRFAAAMAAGSLRLQQAHQTLLEMVDDADPSVRVGVRFALHRLGDTRHSHDLEKTAFDARADVRGDTAMVLGLLEEPTALRVLRAMRRDSDVVVRLQVAEAMWRLGDEGALTTLVAGTVSSFPDDQMISILALAGPRDQRVIHHIRGKLVDQYDEIALVAARAMGELDSDEGYGVALKGARSGDPRQRVLAAMAFGAIGRSDAQPVLAQLLQDGNTAVRLAAATALLQLRDAQA